ncbi:MAG: methylated-DNA--[protein]-cysteine S-methyltransferase [Armatimonadota bacterium]
MRTTSHRFATTLRVAVGESSLGVVLAAWSDRGLYAVQLGDDPGALRSELERRFPGVELRAAGEELAPRLRELLAWIEAPPGPLGMELDLRGTPLQQSVWAALREIPAGATASYAEIAGRIGRARAARAVARACAANPVAVVVPCHRVVRKDGDLSGYRWGVERKRRLLERERHAVAAG